MTVHRIYRTNPPSPPSHPFSPSLLTLSPAALEREFFSYMHIGIFQSFGFGDGVKPQILLTAIFKLRPRVFLGGCRLPSPRSGERV